MKASWDVDGMQLTVDGQTRRLPCRCPRKLRDKVVSLLAKGPATTQEISIELYGRPVTKHRKLSATAQLQRARRDLSSVFPALSNINWIPYNKETKTFSLFNGTLDAICEVCGIELNEGRLFPQYCSKSCKRNSGKGNNQISLALTKREAHEIVYMLTSKKADLAQQRERRELHEFELHLVKVIDSVIEKFDRIDGKMTNEQRCKAVDDHIMKYGCAIDD